MKKAVLFLMCLCVAAISNADLIITEVMSSSSHTNTAANADWWELFNSGSSAVDLTGYSWDDDTQTAGSADFNGLTLAAGGTLIICGETIGAEAAWRSVWGLDGSVAVVNLGNTEFQNLGSTSDGIYVYDSLSQLVTNVIFGAATAGYSFEWNTSGESLGLSVNGENGAFQAGPTAGGGPDIASPGVAIPEPLTGLLTGFCGLGLLLYRRFRA